MAPVPPPTLIVRDLGQTDYLPVYERMRAFTTARDGATPDELWLTEHRPVFTQGQAGRAEHIHAPGDVPVVATDRGGQVTYHGPGQVVGYAMFDLRRLKLASRALVAGLEHTMIEALATFGIAAQARADARGVYVQGAKVGALGLRIRRGCSYHGFALNVAMDLAPFQRINPCGLAGIRVTQVADLGGPNDLGRVRTALVAALESIFGFKAMRCLTEPS